MSTARLIAIALATLVAFALLAGMLFGHTATLKNWTGIDHSVRDVSLALWAFLLPSWFTLEEAWFAPKDPDELAEFYAVQKRGRITWLIVAGAVAILIGSTAPEAPAAQNEKATVAGVAG